MSFTTIVDHSARNVPNGMDISPLIRRPDVLTEEGSCQESEQAREPHYEASHLESRMKDGAVALWSVPLSMSVHT